MQGYPGGKATTHYLMQRIQGASPEQIAAMLLEGGQRFINLTIQAIQDRDLPSQARYVNRASDIIEGVRERLNHEEGGEVVENLVRLCEWWMNELFDGAQRQQPERLHRIAKQMGELKATWEELHRRQAGEGQTPKPSGTIGEILI